MSTDHRPLWAIVPFLGLPDLTIQTADDLRAQTHPTRVVLVDQGSDPATSATIRLYAEHHHPQVLVWTYAPRMPSLSGVWNHGLDFCWRIGESRAWVVNNDVRLDTGMAEALLRQLDEDHPLFISGVGVREDTWPDPDAWSWSSARGGPDFSCYLITKAGHQAYRFDEALIPAYMEDVDAHRRYMLGGDGERIYSINAPFLHLQGGSRTINQSPAARAQFERVAAIGRDYFARKWGGPPNQETFKTPFDAGGLVDPERLNASPGDLARWGEGWFQGLPTTTPELQGWYRTHELTDRVWLSGGPPPPPSPSM